MHINELFKLSRWIFLYAIQKTLAVNGRWDSVISLRLMDPDGVHTACIHFGAILRLVKAICDTVMPVKWNLKAGVLIRNTWQRQTFLIKIMRWASLSSSSSFIPGNVLQYQSSNTTHRYMPPLHGFWQGDSENPCFHICEDVSLICLCYVYSHIFL